MNVATLEVPGIWGILLLVLTQAPGAQPAIYRCASGDVVVYSDRPCAAGANPHELDDSRFTVYTPPPVTTPAATAARRPKADRSGTRQADPARHQARCVRLEQALRGVRNKMRTGYGVKEGERLKARQRQLDEQRRTQKCR